MKTFAIAASAAFVLAGAFAAPAFASAREDQAAAINACRAAIASQANVPNDEENVRFNRIQRRSGDLEVRFRVRQQNGQMSRVDCLFDRDSQQVASTDLGAGAGAPTSAAAVE